VRSALRRQPAGPRLRENDPNNRRNARQHNFADRLEILAKVRESGIKVCSGGGYRTGYRAVKHYRRRRRWLA